MHALVVASVFSIQELVPEDQPAKWKRKTNLEVTRSFHDEAVKELLQDFAASILQVPESAYEDEEESILAMSPVPYEMPNGFHHQFGSERFRLAECLFNPSYIKVNFLLSGAM